MKGVAQPQWSRQYTAPSYKVGRRDDVYALDIFSEIMGGGSTSKLYRQLVVDQQVAVSFSTGYQSDAVSYGTFYVSMIPGPGVTPEEAEAAFEVALADILDDGITAEDVARAKARFAARLAYATDSPMSAARTLGSSLAVGLSVDDVESYPDELAKVMVGQVQDAARRLFTENSSATGILLPKASPLQEGLPREYDVLGFAPLRRAHWFAGLWWCQRRDHGATGAKPWWSSSLSGGRPHNSGGGDQLRIFRRFSSGP